MYTQGFTPACSDVVTIGTPFTSTLGGTLMPIQAYYITILAGGGGDIVWQNYLGDLCWLPGAVEGQTYIMGARAIVASGMVNGVSRTTTATEMIFWGDTQKGAN
jgi:hypothetical protein